MIVGRGIRYRIYGLKSRAEPIAMGIGPALPEGGPPALMLEIAAKPQVNAPSIAFPRFVMLGAAHLPAKFGAEELEFDGEYLTVISSGEYAVPDDIAGRLKPDPVDQAALTEVERLVGERATDEQRPRALLAAGICAARLAPAVLEECADFLVFWPRPGRHISRHSSGVAEVLDAIERSAEDLQTLLEEVALASQHSTFANPLRLAAYWYVRGRAAAAGSMDRFVGLFQSLEALTNCAPQEPNAGMTDFLQTVATLLEAADDPDSARRLELLAAVKERLARPVLSERFERLVRMLNVEQPEAVIRQFAVLNRLRNEILHARITVLPGTFRGINVDRTMVELSARLLNSAADRAIAEVRPRFRVWLTKPGANGLAEGGVAPTSPPAA